MISIQTAPGRCLIASIALFTVTACGDSSGPGEPDNPGVAVVPMTVGGPRHLVWTRDGTELVFSDFSALNAVGISSHTVRRLDPSPVIISVVRHSAGERIYFGTALTSDPNFRVSRVNPSSGAVEILMTISAASDDDFMEVSADERFLVMGRRLFDLQTGSQINLPRGKPFGFSPDGTKLLYDLDVPGVSTPSPSLISTADGSSQALHSTGYFHLAHRWEGNSPQLLKADFELKNGFYDKVRLSEIDGLTGVSRDIAQLSTTAGYFYNTNWSSDGRTLGTWVNQGSIADGTNRTNLYVIRAGGGPVLVASITPPLMAGPPGPPVFSPSGNSLAYFYYLANSRSLYVKSGI